ncbi:UDP-N-acetylmuramoyl-L-alanyl-D-glutamate--2,6-diaminopimelate ligase [methanotrophic endosymbiont of Bathymodiolus puteoserpentis (Logatchev)]|jgi:UDP-N-acetylmuramoyl-L-alanyl-D-glutamate--2,6-diaminopimelate ligase|uniref:UDP-N-acetylmuramoyl-L-alanyl-D-glutamate--2, 6-diaminopimelate ligase n=1 Tax=methanotrophic endosymbiont of Bathymodiolus puteoserpentis (Logatchev) TaxID=343235 RepID=UPI0013CA77B5|nr:UDP-N-acetylmuramoyl-L-alanyl-D-glutamate--2,6-diaminopimelate ligase [methanotrophic endosymbiont of Bathymodiolus puteoserpentis (Logatchev)]SHE20058.1 UDP-N-acetylmuramoylalanyl-D-glutamate--2,6-diaminopimelate ligase [methanotrophic endosymbiont of Bathymodiolus puteoserpentis (Logatchev)]
MQLAELLAGVADVQQDVEVTHLALDSREVSVGGVFFALAGTQLHGMQFAHQVQQQGAVAIIYDPANDGELLAKPVIGLSLVAVEQLADKLGDLAARYYGWPTRQLHVVGITGTNGKTSCSQFLAQVLDNCGVIGTLGWGIYPNLQRTCNTTPDALMLQKIYAEFVEQNIKHVAMEVSSHGLEQGRVNAIYFSGAVFNNLSRDHLDYHGSLEAYFQAKLRLVQWPDLQYAVVNLDDTYAERVLAAISEQVPVFTYSMQDKVHNKDTSIQVRNIQYSLLGIECDVFWQAEQHKLKIALLGDFNLQNCLSVLAVLLAMGKPLGECLQSMQTIKPIIGRMECFTADTGKPMVVVDYAHTPDALEKVLMTLRRHCVAQLTVVFGCGGDRDKGKRAQMGRIAETLADRVIITDDNPRFEEGQTIIDEIIADISMEKVCVINDRKSAIQHSILMSSDRDIVLIAGKGHENYQEIKGVQLPFSDREITQELLAL